MNNELIVANQAMLKELEEILDAVRITHKKIRNKKTPKTFVDKKGGFDFIEFRYMLQQLDEHYPVWSWEIINSGTMGKSYFVHGRLTIIDNGFKRWFDSITSHDFIISKKTNEFIGIENTLKAANTDALKKAINVLTGIGSDVYKVDDIELGDVQKAELIEIAGQMGSKKLKAVKEAMDELVINKENFESMKALLKRQYQQYKEKQEEAHVK